MDMDCKQTLNYMHGHLDRGLKIRPMVLPDAYVEHASPAKMYANAGLDAAGIVRTVFAALGKQLKAPARA